MIPMPALLTALSDLTRWRMLAAMSEAGPLQVVELAQRLNVPATNISKHITVLRHAGIVTNDRPKLYGIRPDLLAEPRDANGVLRGLDFGVCLLRLDRLPQRDKRTTQTGTP
jgi:DNA-binding IclR family transcriptional regulator